MRVWEGMSFHEILEMEGNVEPLSVISGPWGHVLRGSFLGPFLDLPGQRPWEPRAPESQGVVSHWCSVISPTPDHKRWTPLFWGRGSDLLFHDRVGRVGHRSGSGEERKGQWSPKTMSFLLDGLSYLRGQHCLTRWGFKGREFIISRSGFKS